MAVNHLCQWQYLRFQLSHPSAPACRYLSPSRSKSSTSSTAKVNCSAAPSSSPMDSHNEGRKKFMEFPYASGPVRQLMVDLVSTVENTLDSQLLPCTLPPDVQYYENQNGTAQASLQIRSGLKSSLIDFILGSWVHSELPTGAALNITSLSAYLNSSTDAPNLLIELIQSSPSSLVLILDLSPRKDLVLHPDYLQTFYESTRLDEYRQMLEKVPEVRPYFSSSLYLRCVISPSAIMVRVDTETETGAGESTRLDYIITNHVHPVAKQVIGIWLNQCACGGRHVGESDKAYLEKRDGLIKNKTIEIDLGSSFPRLFGPQVASRVLGEIQKVFTA
ncbi:Red chlorophyll catabolite reductase [Citrus sinensis]|uniref:Red chlorophyll catabolite reductase n=2 Tax=Citrus TaxID=2706 RepID=A0A067GHQ3_CITSI|nr:red chlorophyll catabolite reductase, chloroplastic [Citrus x clementina]XP_006466607.2 red chlorophyll catabolite reductase, chloroplastic [Citrus sinensis]ESR39133.1 hypothetical protein CICLE_v10026041mg [Citrus x clementina]KAH9663552.1 Red chlorophyll catabolite reductase [Citrus sinensis]KDO79223.1 hypothetical protein CISIN_1g020001mg [Citrus sinensis]